MGYIQVESGSVVAADHMNLAINQGIPTFATAAERDAAIPAPAIGMHCFLTGSGTMQTHNGFVWVGDEDYATLPLASPWVPGNNVAKMMNNGVVFLHLYYNVPTPGSSLSTQILTLPPKYIPLATIYGSGWIQIGTGYATFAQYVINPTDGLITIYGESTGLIGINVGGGQFSYLGNFLAVR